MLIVGAGPTGLTLACELARRGLKPRVIDAAEGPSQYSKALAVHSRTLEILRDTGVTEEMLAAGLVVRGMDIYSDDGPLGKIDISSAGGEFPFILVLPQSDTERILGARLSALGVQVEWKTKLTGLTQSEQSVVAHLPEGDYQTDWIAGCDGAHSVVRTSTGFSFEGAPYPEHFALADVALSFDKPREPHLFLLHSGLIAFFPLPGGRWRVVADISKLDIADPPSFDQIRQIVEDRVPGAVASDPTWISGFHFHRRKAGEFRKGRVFLLGDAAHIHSPAGGQGMNTGIQDAHNLGWKLALAVQNFASNELLDSYNAEREPIAQTVLRATDALTRAATAKNSLLTGLRDLLLHAALGSESVQHRIAQSVSEENVAYSASPIVHGSGQFFGHAPGDYAGGTPGRDPQHHTLYSIVAPVLDEPWGKEIVHHPMPADSGAALALIRPDGYVAYIDTQRDQEALHHYLKALFKPAAAPAPKPAS